MAPDQLKELRRSFTLALLQAGRAWRRAADTVVGGYGLSEATALALLLIGRLAAAPRQSELAEALSIEGPTLVRLLDQLCAVGLVTRREDPTDRRAKVLNLTGAGKEAVATIEAELVELRATVLAKVSPADLEASLRVFKAIQSFVPHMHAPQELQA